MKVEKLDLHDSELRDIIVNYKEKRLIVITAFPPNNTEKRIVFTDFLYFEITAYSPWGESLYINEMNCIGKFLKAEKSDNNEYLVYYLLMNSGDFVVIIAKEYSCS